MYDSIPVGFRLIKLEPTKNPPWDPYFFPAIKTIYDESAMYSKPGSLKIGINIQPPPGSPCADIDGLMSDLRNRFEERFVKQEVSRIARRVDDSMITAAKEKPPECIIDVTYRDCEITVTWKNPAWMPSLMEYLSRWRRALTVDMIVTRQKRPLYRSQRRPGLRARKRILRK